MRRALLVVALAAIAGPSLAEDARWRPRATCCTEECAQRCWPPAPPPSYREVELARSVPPPSWAAPPTVREVGEHWLVIDTGLASPSASVRLEVDVSTATGETIYRSDGDAIESDGAARICWTTPGQRPPFAISLRLVDAAFKRSPEVVLREVRPEGPPLPSWAIWLKRYLLFVALPFFAGYFATTFGLRRRAASKSVVDES